MEQQKQIFDLNMCSVTYSLQIIIPTQSSKKLQPDRYLSDNDRWLYLGVAVFWAKC